MNNNYARDRRIMESLSAMRDNLDSIKELENGFKNPDELAESVSEIVEAQFPELQKFSKRQLRDIIKAINAETDAQKTIGRSNVKNMKEANGIIEQEICSEILDDEEQNELIVEKSLDFPGFGKATLKRERNLYYLGEDNEALNQSVVNELIETGRTDLLTVNKEKYFTEDKAQYKDSLKHLSGVIADLPTPSLKISWGKKKF